MFNELKAFPLVLQYMVDLHHYECSTFHLDMSRHGVIEIVSRNRLQSIKIF